MGENMYELQKKQQSNSLKKWPVLTAKDTAHYNKTEAHDVYVKSRKPALHHNPPVKDCSLAKARRQRGYRKSHLPLLFLLEECCHEVTPN